MKDNRLPKIMQYGEVNDGQRKPGRLKKSFRECLKEDLKLFETQIPKQMYLNSVQITESGVK